MRVTKFNYPLENNLIKKVNLMIKRCIQHNPKKDSVLLIEGAEGEGKTSLSIALGYYIAEQSNREFSDKNMFWDISKMIKFLQDNEGQIAVWDEPGLQALSTDQLRDIVKNLKRMLMTCRNRRHFIIINMTYFTEFGNYIVWQRPLGMIHVYSRNELEPGRFIYIRKKYLERLWLDWRNKKQRNYVKYQSKRCRGTFPDVLNPDYKHNVLSEFDLKAYEKIKNENINLIGREQKKVTERDLRLELINKILRNNTLKKVNLSQKALCELLGIAERTFYRYKEDGQLSDIEKVQLNNNVGIAETFNQNQELISNT